MSSVPEGYVDPLDPAAVAAVVARTQDAMGLDGVVDLLGRLPGVHRTAGRPKRLFQAAEPATVHLGPEHLLTLTEPPEYLHVVNGVVLHRDRPTPGQLPALLGRLVATLARDSGRPAEAAAVLTAARETLDRF